MPAPDHYAVLQVTADAHPEVIKAAYRALAAKFHPDAYPGPDAHERMVRINLAYEVLSSPDRRRQHDAQMAAAGLPLAGIGARPRCPACGLAVGWMDGRCRVCRPAQLADGGTESDTRWVEVASEWPLRVELPLVDALAVIAHAMRRCGLSPVAIQSDSSDGRLEAPLTLGEARDTNGGSVSCGFWCDGASATALRMSVAGTLALHACEGGRSRRTLDWWMQQLGRELELCLDHPPRSWRTGR
jgi:hypothetical protein